MVGISAAGAVWAALTGHELVAAFNAGYVAWIIAGRLSGDD